jgi:hypothetical protein
MERFSVAHIAAIAANAGCGLTEERVDEDGIDLHLSRQGQHAFTSTPTIAIQLKSTTSWTESPTSIGYELRKRNYDLLRGGDYLVPRILAVLLMPRELDDWILYHPEMIALHHRVYWMSLVNAPESPNEYRVTVAIPKSQLLDAHGLVELMNRVAPDGLRP